MMALKDRLRKRRREEQGYYTLQFLVALIWMVIIILAVLQLGMITHAYSVANYAAYAASRSCMVDGGDYKAVGRNVLWDAYRGGHERVRVWNLPTGNVLIIYSFPAVLFPINIPVAGQAPLPDRLGNAVGWPIWKRMWGTHRGDN